MERYKREKRIFDEVIIRYLIEDWIEDDDENYDKYFDAFDNPTPLTENFQLVKDDIYMYDLEDGYATHYIVIFIQNEDKYFQGEYTELSNDSNEYGDEFFEVFPETKTLTIYR